MCIMPKLYLCQPHGPLRTVLTWEQSTELGSVRDSVYVGTKFPGGTDSDGSFAVLKVDESESTKEWKPGFYRLQTSVKDLNASLRELSF